MENPKFFNGVHAVLYAMFQADEQLDHTAMATQVDYCIDKGCHGISVLGLATEVLKLTPDERKTLIRTAAKAINGRVPFSVTLAGNSVAEQAELAQFAQDNGADWLILQPPMAGNYAADVYLDFFERVAKTIALPIAIQNAPQYLGRALSATDIECLRERCDNFAAVKSEDAALSMHNLLTTVKGKLAILGGRGGLEMTDNLRAGCSGFVLAPDIAPVATHIFDCWQAGDTKQAEQLYAQVAPAIMFSIQSLEHLITYGKRLFAIQARLDVYDRLPCLSPSRFGLETTERWAVHLQQLDALKH